MTDTYIDGDFVEVIMGGSSEWSLSDHLEDTCSYCDRRPVQFRPDDSVALCHKHRHLWSQAVKRGVSRSWMDLVMMGHEADE